MSSQNHAGSSTLNMAFRCITDPSTVVQPQENAQTPTPSTFTLPLRSRGHDDYLATVNQSNTASVPQDIDSRSNQHALPTFNTLRVPTSFPLSALRSTADIVAPSTVTQSRVQLHQLASSHTSEGLTINTLHMLHHLLHPSYSNVGNAQRHIKRILGDRRWDLPLPYSHSLKERKKLARRMSRTGRAIGMFRIIPVLPASNDLREQLDSDDQES